MTVHPERERRTRSLNRLDPATDWHQIYRRLTLWELPAEARFGFQLSFYRPLAVPRTAKILHQTGHLHRETTRRAYDTGLVIHEIIWGGVDSHRGRRMVNLMNALHRRRGIHPEDMTYVLNSLIVVPTRFMDRHGWRTVTPSERAATWRFYDILGARMSITDRPRSYHHAVQQFDEYEARNVQPSVEGAALTQATLAALRDRLPAPARPFTAEITSCLVGDPRISEALGLPPPRWPTDTAVALGSAVRQWLERHRPPTRQPSFWPGMPAGTPYPHGYRLDQLGP